MSKQAPFHTALDPARGRMRDSAAAAMCAFVCVFAIGYVFSAMGDRPLWRHQPLERTMEDQWQRVTMAQLRRWDEKRARGKRLENEGPPFSAADSRARHDPTRPAYARRWDGTLAFVRPDGDALPVPHELLSMDWYGRTLLALQWAACAALAVLGGAAVSVLLSPRTRRGLWARAMSATFAAGLLSVVAWLAVLAVRDAPQSMAPFKLQAFAEDVLGQVPGAARIVFWIVPVIAGAAYSSLGPGLRRGRAVRSGLLVAVFTAIGVSLVLYAIISVDILQGNVVDKG